MHYIPEYNSVNIYNSREMTMRNELSKITQLITGKYRYFSFFNTTKIIIHNDIYSKIVSVVLKISSH